MMLKREFQFPIIHLALPEDAILRRLGFRSGITAIDAEQLLSIRQAITKAMGIIELSGVARIVPISGFTDEVVYLEGGVNFRSVKLSAFLAGAQEALLMAATAGAKVMEEIRNAARDDLRQSMIYDATASEVVDDALSWIQAYMGGALRREGYIVVRRRFSAGYGDFALSHQRDFYEILALDKLGLSLTAGFMLVPKKSVTAICAVKKIEQTAK